MLPLLTNDVCTLIPFFEPDGQVVPAHMELINKLDKEKFAPYFWDPNEVDLTNGKWPAVLGYLAQGVPGYYVVWDNETVQPIGFLGAQLFYGTVEKPLVVDMGILFTETYKGTAAYHAAFTFINHCFKETSIKRIQSLTPVSHNTKFYERLGFVNEGTARGVSMNEKGQMQNAIMFSALRADWFNPRSKTYKGKEETIKTLDKLSNKEKQVLQV